MKKIDVALKKTVAKKMIIDGEPWDKIMDETHLRLKGHSHAYYFNNNNVIDLPPLSSISGNSNLGFVVLATTGGEYILDIYKNLENNFINYHEQKVIKKTYTT